MNKKCLWSMMAVPFLLLAALSRPGQTARAEAGAAGAAKWQEYFDRVIPEQLDSLHIAGAVVSVVEGGEQVFAKGYGYADVENRIEVRPETTLFRIGSASKLFTWTAVMQLVERRELDLDADVNGYLDFRIPDTYPRPVTLRHLMAHTAGFEDRVAGMLAADPQGMIPLGRWLAANIPARVRQPGEVSSYSNYGAALAGYIVERVSGTPFEEYLEQNIFEPLGMERTTIRQPLMAGWAADMSQGYVFNSGRFFPMDFEYIVPFPTGAVTSTAADMARFISAHLGMGRSAGARILQENTASLMQSLLFGHDPRLNGWAYGFYEMNRNGVRVIGHGGDSRLFHSLVAILPKKNLGLFAAYNSENAFDVQTLLLNDFLDEFFPADPPADEKIHLSPAEWTKFAGSYRQNRRFAETTVEKAANLLEPVLAMPTADGALFISSAVYGAYRFLPVEPTVFAQEDDPQNLLIFHADSEGIITHAFLSSDPSTVFLKLPWYADYSLHYGILTAGIFLFLSTLVLAGIRWVVRRVRRHPAGDIRPAVSGRRVFGLLSMAGVLFPVGFVFTFGGIAYGETALLSIVLALPIVMLALAPFAAYFIIRSWRERFWPVLERCYFMLVLAGAVVYIWSLNYWNLLGWKY